MRVFYRDDVVSVDTSTIVIDGRRFELAGFSRVWYRTRRSGGGYLRSKMFAIAALGSLAVIGIVAALVTADFGAYGWHVLTGALVVGIFLVALAGFGVDPVLDLLDRGHEHGRGVHELWARVEGRDVLLFSTPDSLRFGKIYRSLGRAIERSTPIARRVVERP